MRSDFRPSTVAGTKEAAALRDFDPGDVRLGVISGPHAVLRPRPLCPPKADINRRERHVRFVPNVWSGRAVQDGLPRSTNVRAASMYQASEVEQFAPGHHGYPRASEAD